jgi:hypothetical protein
VQTDTLVLGLEHPHLTDKNRISKHNAAMDIHGYTNSAKENSYLLHSHRNATLNLISSYDNLGPV